MRCSHFTRLRRCTMAAERTSRTTSRPADPTLPLSNRQSPTPSIQYWIATVFACRGCQLSNSRLGIAAAMHRKVLTWPRLPPAPAPHTADADARNSAQRRLSDDALRALSARTQARLLTTPPRNKPLGMPLSSLTPIYPIHPPPRGCSLSHFLFSSLLFSLSPCYSLSLSLPFPLSLDWLASPLTSLPDSAGRRRSGSRTASTPTSSVWPSSRYAPDPVPRPARPRPSQPPRPAATSTLPDARAPVAGVPGRDPSLGAAPLLWQHLRFAPPPCKGFREKNGASARGSRKGPPPWPRAFRPTLPSQSCAVRAAAPGLLRPRARPRRHVGA